MTFTNGETITTDLLIGAEGAWSKVRSLLTDVKPSYCGTSLIKLYVHNSDQTLPASAKAVGNGTMIALAPGKGLLNHRESDGTIHTYVALNKPEEWISNLDISDIAKEFEGWAPELTALITASDTKPIFRTINALPIGHRWERVAGVTLLGDAAHLMSPFEGEGANLALFDGAELAKAIIAHPGDVEAALAAYEAEMFPRSAAAAEESDKNMKMFFNESSPQGVVDFFTAVSR